MTFTLIYLSNEQFLGLLQVMDSNFVSKSEVHRAESISGVFPSPISGGAENPSIGTEQCEISLAHDATTWGLFC